MEELFEMKEIRIGLLGLGNIGTGTYKALEMNREIIEKKVGAKVNIVKILEKDIDRERDITVTRDQFVSDPDEIFKDPDIDIVIELLGGVDEVLARLAGILLGGLHHQHAVLRVEEVAAALPSRKILAVEYRPE